VPVFVLDEVLFQVCVVAGLLRLLLFACSDRSEQGLEGSVVSFIGWWSACDGDCWKVWTISDQGDRRPQ
jgi:hypothetical protein